MSNKLHLDPYRKVFYYFPAAYGVLAAAITYAIDFYVLAGVFVVATLYAVYRLRRDLQFRCVLTSRTPSENYSIVLAAIQENNWEIRKQEEDRIIEAATYPSFWTGSWGEMVTVRFENRRVLINSICDPHKNPSITTWGRNEKNIVQLETALRRANITHTATAA